ncbi:hypothetical protein OQA88_2971 [Cercophora sp. LCS_1]
MTTIFDIPGTNPPNPFTTPTQTYLSNPHDDHAASTASELIAIVTTSSDPSSSLFYLWDAFFTSVVHVPSTTPNSFTPHLILLSAIRAHKATKPTQLIPGSDRERTLHASGHLQPDGHFHWSKLPLFPAQWGDTHDIIQDWRSWDGVRSSGVTTDGKPADFYLRFLTFSAVMLGQTAKASEIHPVNVFYAARGVLEREGKGEEEKRGLDVHQLWELDVRATAVWLRYAARRLWDMDGEQLRGAGYDRTLDSGTDLWGEGEGLKRERWVLWRDRLEVFEGEVQDAETKEEVREARKVVDGLLGE